MSASCDAFVSLVRDEQGRGSVLDGRTVLTLLLGLGGALGFVAHSNGLGPGAILEDERKTFMCGMKATSTEVDSTWRRIELEMKDPRSVDGTLQIALLRPDVWVQAVGARVGAMIDLEMPEMHVRGRARVTSVGGAPTIKPGVGRVVLSTIASQSNAVMVLRFEGTDETLEPTVSHPLFSLDRNEWVRADELRMHERLRTMHGSAKIAAIARKPGTHRVYNLEVETEHEFLVSSLGVQSHNDQPCGQPRPARKPPMFHGWGVKYIFRDLAATVRNPLLFPIMLAKLPAHIVVDYGRTFVWPFVPLRDFWYLARGKPRPEPWHVFEARMNRVQPWAREAAEAAGYTRGHLAELVDRDFIPLRDETLQSLAQKVGSPLTEIMEASSDLRNAAWFATNEGVVPALGRPRVTARWTYPTHIDPSFVVLDPAYGPDEATRAFAHEVGHHLDRGRSSLGPANFGSETEYVRSSVLPFARKEARALLFEEHVMRQARSRGVRAPEDTWLQSLEDFDAIQALFEAGEVAEAERWMVRSLLRSTNFVDYARGSLRYQWRRYERRLGTH